jgi:hypothetical protein
MTNPFMDLAVPLNNCGQNVDRHSNSGTEDDDDDRDDEHARENEAPVREIDEGTEVPEEFEPEPLDEPPRPEVDDDYDLSVPADRGAPPVSVS